MDMLRQWLLKRLSRAVALYLKAHGLIQANQYTPAMLWEAAGALLKHLHVRFHQPKGPSIEIVQNFCSFA
jgi:hypothetical protein